MVLFSVKHQVHLCQWRKYTRTYKSGLMSKISSYEEKLDLKLFSVITNIISLSLGHLFLVLYGELKGGQVTS